MDAGTAKRSASSILWGRMAECKLSERVVSLVFVTVAIVAMSFCQLGFWPLCVIDDKPVYLMLILGPLLMGAFMFGPLTGGLLGLFAGTVVFAHAQLFPLDFYEFYYMSWVNAFVLLTVIGAAGGWLFSLVVRKAQGGARRGLIFAVSIVLSFAASGLLMGGVVIVYGALEDPAVSEAVVKYLFNSPLGITVQAVVDALLVAILCWAADYAIARIQTQGDNRRLQSVFRNWMLLVSAIVFMVSSAILFSMSTFQLQQHAEEDMKSEVQYLINQIENRSDQNLDLLIDGYDVPTDGYVAILDPSGRILASNDESRYPKGGSYLAAIGYSSEDYSVERSDTDMLDLFASEDELPMLQENDPSGILTMNAVTLAVGKYDNGYVTLLRTSQMILASRFSMMASSTVLALALIVAISILAAILLRNVVVLRINDTNVSLAKITNGDLKERVHKQDTFEFSSLANGINSTVTALNGMMDEIAARNAQDLATAKAIQESALPHEFPPFPDIDKFDIYASMKTAKEVGGDFYDFFLIGEKSNKLGFVMADVSGKGIPAALFMMTAKTQLRNFIEAELPLGEAINAANSRLCIGNDAGMFVTVWVGVLDYDTGLLTYVNGGHNPPMLLTGGSWEWVSDVSGMPLGLFDGIPYDEFERQLAPGDMLYTYTDGVTEAMDANDQLFGEDRLETALEGLKDMNPRSVGIGVRRALTDFTKDADQSDDITMLILKYGAPPEKRADMVLDADDKQLPHVFNFINEELKRRNAPKSVYGPLGIAAEELFVNVCHYAYPDATPENPGEVRLSYEHNANPPSLTVTIADDGIPYDPLAKPDPEAHDNIADVPIGGLGIYMTKRSVDDISYERVDNSNVVTFTKKW